MNNTKISVITVSFNSKVTINDTIRSVLSQSYKNIEHIVIDGNSSDGTQDVVRQYKTIKLVSEKDSGLYDAMNKGIKMSSGDIVAILNSDDLYYDEKVIEDVVKEFERTGADAVYGDLVYVEKDDAGKIVRHWKSSKCRKGDFIWGWHPAHPAFFVKREIYEKYGVFDTSYEFSADFELMLRFMERFHITSSYIPRTLVRMRLGGESNKSLGNIIKGNINCMKAFRKNGIWLNPFYPLYRILPKMNQYLLARIHCRPEQGESPAIRQK